MNATFSCLDCEQTVRLEVQDGTKELACPNCGRAYAIPDQAIVGSRLTRCLICPCKELFVRKDFPQGLGVTIVVLGFVASSIAWGFHMKYTTFGILFATALIDVALYFIVGNVLQCYRCRAEYRSLAGLDEHEAFRLETHERHRQQIARLAESKLSQAGKPPRD